MQRSNETKAKAFRIEFFLLFLFFLIGGAGFFLSLSSLDDSEPKAPESFTFHDDSHSDGSGGNHQVFNMLNSKYRFCSSCQDDF